MSIEMSPIGFVSTDAEMIPRSWTVSDVEGTLVIDESYLEGIRDIQPGQRIYVIFHFHKSPKFTPQYMRIKPQSEIISWEFSALIRRFALIPSAYLLEVLGVSGNIIRVKGLDILDGTPVLDIKPEVCP
jgi:tRNA (Thr-GGU) A37 N-methylase